MTSVRPNEPVAAVVDQAGKERTPTPRRIRVAEWLAFVGLVAAVIGAIGPAEKVRTTYTWPPASLPSGSPETSWYTPLLLAAQNPERLTAEIPCQLSRPLPDAGRLVTVLATARAPEANNGFRVAQVGDELRFEVGGRVLARAPANRETAPGRCAYRMDFHEGAWSLTGGPTGEGQAGELGYMPVVTGLFSEIDLRQGPAPTATVLTQIHATNTTSRQMLCWLVAVLAVLAALVLVSYSNGGRSAWGATTAALGRGARRLGAVDAVVGVALVSWWVLSPVFYDDGWVIARQRGYEASGGFSTHYNGLGTNLPNGYWLEWLQHWITQSFDAFVVLRIPALACLAATWLVCRWTLERAVGRNGSTRTPTWTLAAAFLGGAMAWGMTLRPEPVTALLVTGCLASAVYFHERQTTCPVAVLAALVVLAMTAHHAGVVALAPAVAIAPRLFRWTRAQFPAAVAILLATVALALALVFVGADIDQRSADAQATRNYGGIDDTWRDEATRYELLSVLFFATPLRRGWTALMLLAVVAFLLRRRREHTALDLPAASLGIALVLLIATPSKWPWHFGALIGIAAVAVAAETVRLRRDAHETRGWSAKPFVVFGAALLALVWAFALRELWNPIDLRTLDWTESTAWLSGRAVTGALVLVLAMAAIIATRARKQPLSYAPWYPATTAGLIVTIPLIAFTAGVLALDAMKTDGWTLTRQNLQSLSGAADCGLADELQVPNMASVHAVDSGSPGQRVPAWLRSIPVADVPRHLVGNAAARVPRASPWYALTRRPVGLFVSGPSNALALQWGVSRDGVFEPLSRTPITAARVPVASETYLPWAFLLASELPQPPPTADSVRVVVNRDASPRGTLIGVSAPVTYETRPLSRILERNGASFVHPAILPYFPCARQPEIRNGVVEVPDQILGDIGQTNPVLVVGTVGPFSGVLDLYQLNRLSLSDSAAPPPERIAYEVEKHLEGAVEARADAVTELS